MKRFPLLAAALAATLIAGGALAQDLRRRPAPGASVTGSWSGIVAGSGSALTVSNGSASFTSPQTRASGAFVFTVTGVTLSGYAYNGSLNTETSDSVTR